MLTLGEAVGDTLVTQLTLLTLLELLVESECSWHYNNVVNYDGRDIG